MYDVDQALADGPIIDVLPEAGRRVIRVRWLEEQTILEAFLARVGDIVKLVSFSMRNADGLPTGQRSVPTEAHVLALVRDQGRDGWGYWPFLMGETLHYEGALSELTDDKMHTILGAYQKEHFKKPHSRRPELIDVARQLLQKGVRSQDVLNTLRGFGISESTAWRYMKRARAIAPDVNALTVD